MAKTEPAVSLRFYDLLPFFCSDAIVAVGSECITDLDFSFGSKGAANDCNQRGKQGRLTHFVEHHSVSSSKFLAIEKLLACDPTIGNGLRLCVDLGKVAVVNRITSQGFTMSRNRNCDATAFLVP